MIRRDIKEFLSTLPNNVTLVAATKYGSVSDLRTLYDAGVNNFGENRVDAFEEKFEELKDLPITWHFIGHLQRNKAAKVANKIQFLHSLDSLELAQMLNKYRETPLNCFVEVSVNQEETKNGINKEDTIEFIKNLLEYKNINVVGLMMMSIKYSDKPSLNKQFKELSDLRDEIVNELNISLPYLSMGMSDDYEAAIENNATHIRLGRILFDNK